MKNSEHICQVFAMSYLKKLQHAGYDFMMWSTPNGGGRSKAEAGRLKLEGVLSGVPDISIMAKGIMVFVEFKMNKGILSPNQKDFIAKAKTYGFESFIVYGDTPTEVLPQIAKIMEDVFSVQKGISNCSISSVLGNTLLAVKS